MNDTRTQFWLQIRKEYIIDNFENLLNYFVHYDYDREVNNSDYNASLECLRQLSQDIFNQLSSTPLYLTPEFKYSRSLIIRLLCADVLASFKAGKPAQLPILALSMLFVKTDLKLDLSVIESIKSIVISCLTDQQLSYPGFSWNDISNPDLRGEVLIYKFRMMRFNSPSGSPKNFFAEQNGLFIITPDRQIDLSLVNQALYSQNKCETVFSLPCNLQVLAEIDTYEKSNEFPRHYHVLTRLIKSQSGYRPSPAVAPGIYSYDDCFPVKIISKAGWRMEAHSLDPRYEPLQGKLLLEMPLRRPKSSMLKDMLNIGDIVMVFRSKREGYAFEIFDAFEDFYRNQACSYSAQEKTAVFVTKYSNGTEWITEDGIRVGIDRSKQQGLDEEDGELFIEAIETRTPIIIRFYKEAPDIEKEEFNVYAEPRDFFEESVDVQLNQEIAERTILQQFIDFSREQSSSLNPARCSTYAHISVEHVASVIPVLYRMGKSQGYSSRTRLEYLTATALVANICDKSLDVSYLEHECAFLNAEVAFASNSEIRPLPHNASFDDVEQVKRHEQIIASLSSYRKKVPTLSQPILNMKRDTDTVGKVETLVSASNSLIDIIDETELNNIKQSIARVLDVEDEYVPILEDRTYYGSESIALEFKTSIVYPPVNRRRAPSISVDPDLQKWAILKAVCGFLNSRSGGDLLIGVNDAGYAVGLEQDIQELHKLKYISSPDEDHYRLYIMQQMYRAFAESDSNASNSDIANTHIDCFPEENAEGRVVMRVKVKPYQKAIVKLVTPPEGRPTDVEDSYVRLSGRTVAVSPGMREQILKYKN